MIRFKQPVILNSVGQPIVLNSKEKLHAAWSQREFNNRHGNALGYEVSITTLTTIVKKISEQSFYEIPPADFVPLVVGEGAWSSNLTTYRSFELGDEFETGVINTGAGNARLASTDAGVDALNIKVFNWAKAIGWAIPDLEMAAKSGNWDLIGAKEESRKKNWDLGIQRIAFLGARGSNGAGGFCLGLLNQPGITTDTTTITKPISSMTTAELKTFVAAVVEKFRSNCQRTAWPSHFVVPESDYNGMASQASPDFPIKSTLELLEDAFKITTRNKSFQLLPLAYGDAAYNTAEINKQCYALYKYDEKTFRMNLPVDYTNTLANSVDNFSFQNAGYGQFTGVQVLKPLEMMYFQYTP